MILFLSVPVKCNFAENSSLDLIWNVKLVMTEAASEMSNAAGSCILVVMHNSNLILILYLLPPVLDTQYQFLST